MDFFIEDIAPIILLIILLLFCIGGFILLGYMISSKTYYYVDSYGVEHEVDYCSSNYGAFYCHDFESGTKFLVDGYRYDFKEKE